LLTAFGSPYPQPTKWLRIGNQIDAAMILTRADFVNVQWGLRTLARDLEGSLIGISGGPTFQNVPANLLSLSFLSEYCCVVFLLLMSL
jgi:hypothetical protein